MAQILTDIAGPSLWPMIGAEDQRFYDMLRQWIEDVSVAEGAMGVGQRMPEFALPDEAGRTISTRDLLARGPLVLNFIGGMWCAYCIANLKSLDRRRTEIETLGANLIAVTPSISHYSRALKKRYRIDGHLLSDAGSGVALHFGLSYAVPDTIQAIMAAKGINLADLHGSPYSMLPLPATYVIESSGIISAAYIGTDLTTAIDSQAIVDAIRSVRSKASLSRT